MNFNEGILRPMAPCVSCSVSHHLAAENLEGWVVSSIDMFNLHIMRKGIFGNFERWWVTAENSGDIDRMENTTTYIFGYMFVLIRYTMVYHGILGYTGYTHIESIGGWYIYLYCPTDNQAVMDVRSVEVGDAIYGLKIHALVALKELSWWSFFCMD